ncbi:retinal guanylyl cyclase 1-like [Oratosquilla oratoria]|uniref:retinal guanylyl cyclase 1-like n=1 Tax=Oratosquilla oratoria TaxID=337810 RepID=UPI003F767D12
MAKKTIDAAYINSAETTNHRDGNWLQQKEMSKGPYKILLTSADLTLTNRPDSSAMKSGSGGSAGRGRNGDGGLTGRGGGRGRSGVSGRAGGMGALGAGVIGAAIASGGTGSSTPSTAAGAGSLSSVRNTAAELLLKTTHSRASSVRDLDESKAKFNASGDLVHVRYFYHSGHFEVKNKTMNLLKQMHNLRHENVNSFFGLLCDPSRPALVFDYCSRGSLQDVIKQEDIKLDWSFRLSLLTDLVRGMRYLHSSPIRHHGNLTSRNCVIDARWVLRVTDYGMPTLSEAQNLPPPCFCSRDLLWKSPEQLRDDGLMSRGSQTSDVFSFSIIMQEVVVRGEPYCMVQLTAQEIIARLKKPPPMIRPSVSKGAAPPDAINIMKQCWAEQPEMRPDFTQIYDLFKKLNQGRRLNIVDTMFQMLEKYSSNLEELIRERTDQLDLEKKKTEQLLNRMLPRYVNVKFTSVLEDNITPR